MQQWKDSGYTYDCEAARDPQFEAMKKALSACTKRIYDGVKQSGLSLVDFAPLPHNGIPEFIRPVTSNPRLEEKHLADMLALWKRMAIESSS